MKKSHPVLFRSKAETFAFIDTQHARYGVTRLCRRYGVTRAGFYAWRRRPVSAHAQQDRTLLTANTRLFMQHHGRYGSPRIHHLLRGEDWVVSRRRVARLMRAAGLRGKAVRGYRGKVGTHRFCEQHPNRVRTMAVQRRRPPRGLIFHSDRGSEYLAAPFRDYLAARGIQAKCVRERARRQRAHGVVLPLVQGGSGTWRDVQDRGGAAPDAAPLLPVLQSHTPALRAWFSVPR